VHLTRLDEPAKYGGWRDPWSGDEPVTTVRLRELPTSPERALVMYGKRQSSPRPMRTLWIDVPERGIDLLSPQGRGQWYAGLDY
jgi:hypothetical protein